MKPGDKVRLLTSTDEGVIRNIADNNVVEVENQDGFIIPVPRSELVVVASEESEYFHGGEPVRNTSPAPAPSEVQHEQEGILLAIVPFNDQVFQAYLVNSNNEQIHFTYYHKKSNSVIGITAGQVEAGSSHLLNEIKVKELDQWPEMIFHILFFSPGTTTLKAPLVKSLKLRGKKLFRNKRTVPVLKKEGSVFSLDTEVIKVNPEELTDAFFRESQSEQNIIQAPPKEVDLHLEKLIPDPENFPSDQILNLQVSTFEKYLGDAIGSGMEEIIFIHGVGNGKLRQEIHRHLSNSDDISYFKDAQKEKFGYGATYVKL